MPNEIVVAVIGSAGTIVAALIAALVGRGRESRASKPRPRTALAFFTALSTGLSITALLFAFAATSSDAPEDVKQGEIYQNKTRRAYFVTLSCNATGNTLKTMEARVGMSREELSLVASESGGDRMSASVVVPPGWFYRVDVQIDVQGEAQPGCNFKQWSL